jgi:hypothetical protein
MAMVNAVCDLNAACGCAPGCDAKATGHAEDILTIAANEGLSYDPQCMGELVRRVEQAQCDLSDEPSEPACEESCRPFFGTLAAGEQCQPRGTSNLRGFPIVLDPCDAENVCITNVCQPRCRLVGGVPEGEPCWFDECGDGLVCSVDTDTCVQGPGVGESCSQDFLDCGAGWCETGDLICQPPGERGDSCSSFTQCESGYCPNGTCQARPALGEDCYGPCQDGSRCSSSVCIPHVCWH